MLGDSAISARDTANDSDAVDFRMSAVALLVPCPERGSRALLAEIDSEALRDALTYLGARVAAVRFDAAAISSERAYLPPGDSGFDTVIVDTGAWSRAAVSEADQSRMLVELTGRMRPGAVLLMITLNPIAQVWAEARARGSRRRAAIDVASWLLRRRHPLSLLARPWGNAALTRAGLFPGAVFLPSSSMSDLRSIRSRRAPTQTSLRQSWRPADRLTRFLLRHFGHYLASEHIVLWSTASRGRPAPVPLCHEIGGDRCTLIPMPAGLRVGIDSENGFVKFPLDQGEADWTPVEVEDTNRAAADVWHGYATPWATLEAFEEVPYARFPHIDHAVRSRAEAEEALAEVYRHVTARADEESLLGETDVVRRATSASAAPKSAERRRALRAVRDVGQQRVAVMLSHGDLHEANILISDRETRIIDWESAQSNPVFLDPLFSANYFRHQGVGWFDPLIAWVRGEDIGPLGRIAEEHLDGLPKTTAALLAILHGFNNYESEGAVPDEIVRDAEQAIRVILGR
ncbi:hypothetical protein GCM10009775_10060 [Microbacterium aoyamense]|uniref:Aminoglycoside phosphotransferase domain-containing protein n=1 Tax=Microbacterium aoyamense TaxID=344166 RepID=A0ABN2PHK2_9MICO|nr:phosphotransferase [Microbacterium aoyamense]